MTAAAFAPGDVLLFRYRDRYPAKHAAIATAPDLMVHAHDGAAVAEVAIAPWWRRRLALLRFPGVTDRLPLIASLRSAPLPQRGEEEGLMASLVLSVAGAAVGGAVFGPAGAIAGRIVGAIGGIAHRPRAVCARTPSATSKARGLPTST